MSSITLYLDEATEARLRLVAGIHGMAVEGIAAIAVASAAVDYFHLNPVEDPGRPRVVSCAGASLHQSSEKGGFAR
ncbi:hypothetical protein [Sinorhizobium americanum]|uniref:Uncharacterized protein n=1 Tax=Sinorhizobium americanum TaxID=194963 RepID=A0A4R2BTW2_9HYPH|nr:hypothetical protein [Sinorhizobium americanum]TCN30302.1 hypothetical protein EV184_108176 [Sinorhizobium americanum]